MDMVIIIIQNIRTCKIPIPYTIFVFKKKIPTQNKIFLFRGYGYRDVPNVPMLYKIIIRMVCYYASIWTLSIFNTCCLPIAQSLNFDPQAKP